MSSRLSSPMTFTLKTRVSRMFASVRASFSMERATMRGLNETCMSQCAAITLSPAGPREPMTYIP